MRRRILINPSVSYIERQEKEDYWKDAAVIRPSAREKSHWKVEAHT